MKSIGRLTCVLAVLVGGGFGQSLVSGSGDWSATLDGSSSGVGTGQILTLSEGAGGGLLYETLWYEVSSTHPLSTRIETLYAPVDSTIGSDRARFTLLRNDGKLRLTVLLTMLSGPCGGAAYEMSWRNEGATAETFKPIVYADLDVGGTTYNTVSWNAGANAVAQSGGSGQTYWMGNSQGYNRWQVGPFPALRSTLDAGVLQLTQGGVGGGGDYTAAISGFTTTLAPGATSCFRFRIGGACTATPGVAFDYQRNSCKAWLDHNGVVGTGSAPAVTHVMPSGLVTANFSTTLAGMPHEAVLAYPGPQVPRGAAGAVALNDGQVLNIDLSGPSASFFYGGVNPSFQPAQNLSFAFGAPPFMFTWSAQVVIFDPTSPSLLTLSAANTIAVAAPISVLAEAVGTNSYNTDTSSGYFRFTSMGAPISQLVLDSMNSSVPGQGTLVFDTDQTGMADVFNGGNSTLIGCQGTYRNGSDVAAGLSYGASIASPCDPGALTGFTPSNPDSPGSSSYRTLTFDFSGGLFAGGVTFEFDCDTDFGNGITGGSMAGLVVTVVGPNGPVSGELVADPGDPNRSFVLIQQ